MARTKANAAPAKVSGKTVFVFSTLANDQNYTHYTTGPDLPIEVSKTFIRGGTGVADNRLITPIGVMTEIPESDYELLKTNPEFKAHVERGYITVREGKADAEMVASDMNTQDESSPLTPADFENKEPKTGSAD